MRAYTVRIPGTPVPQGSSRAFVRGGRAVVTSANPRLRSWRADAAWSISEVARRDGPLEGPVHVGAVFLFPRPVSHFGRKGLLPSAPMLHAQKPDLDKLLRALLDAMTEGGAIRDDSRVVSVSAYKAWTEGEPGTMVSWQEAPGAPVWPQYGVSPREWPRSPSPAPGRVLGHRRAGVHL